MLLRLTSVVDDDGNTWYEVPFLVNKIQSSKIWKTILQTRPDVSVKFINNHHFLLKLVKRSPIVLHDTSEVMVKQN